MLVFVTMQSSVRAEHWFRTGFEEYIHNVAMRNRESEGHTDSAVEDSTRAPLLSRRRVHKTFPLKSPRWIAVLTERALSTRSSAVHAQQRCGSRALARLASQEAGTPIIAFPLAVLPENLACPQGIFKV